MARRTVRFYLALQPVRPDATVWTDGLPPLDLVEDGWHATDYGDGGGEHTHRGVTSVGIIQLSNDDFLHVRVGRIRRTDLPSGYDHDAGEFGDLDIPVDLAEITDLLFLRNGIIAELVNRDGPSISTVLRYIEAVWAVPIDAMAAIRPDALARLRSKDEIMLAEIAVPVRSVDALAEGADGLREAARNAARLPSVGHIKLVLRPEAGGGEEFLAGWLPIMERLAASSDGGTFDSLKVSGRADGASETIDLLQQRIQRRVSVDFDPKARQITHGAARKALVDAYEEERGELETALSDVAA